MKDVAIIWHAIEQYRQAGGREEHWMWKERIEQLLDELVEWKHAVEHEVILTCCESNCWNDPKALLNHIINWNIAVALDPKVSQAAQDLIKQGEQNVSVLRE